MPGDDFRKRASGEPFVMKAPLYNALIDAARRSKQNRHDVAGNFQPDHRSSTIVPIRNGSGGDKSRGDVLGIAGPVVGPSDNLNEFLGRIALQGASPTLAHVARWGVLLEPLAAGAIGRAVVSGLAVCQITMRNDKHQYLEVNNSGELESGDSGSARIVWVEGASGTQWAVINIDSPRTLQAKFELIDDLEEGGTAQGYLLYQDNLGNWRRVDSAGTFSVNAGDYSVENPANDDRSGPSFTGVKFGGADAGNSGDVVEAVGWIEGTTLRWFAVGAGHKVVTGTNQGELSQGAVGQVAVDLQAVDGRTVAIFAKALTDLQADAEVVAWWNGPLRQWVMIDPSKVLYDAGCGITIDDETNPPTIAVDNVDLVGPGLAPDGECGLAVVAGCGIQVGADVSVDPVALAGAGLVPAGGCALAVNPGCGVRVENDQVTFEPEDVVGAGLGKVGDCGIDVLRGCGLVVNENNELEVNLDEVAGDGAGGAQYGLVVFSETGCDRIGVSTGCGIAFDATSGALIVSNGELAGCGLTTEAECGLAVDPAAIAGPGLVPAGAGCAVQVATGCGIVFGLSNELEVDLRGFDGPGLSAWQNPATECWGLQVDQEALVDPGCGLEFDAVTDQLQVKPSDLAGAGLVPAASGCALQVSTGCGIAFDPESDALIVSNEELAGCGLQTDGECGLAVDPDALAGAGLVPAGVGCAVQVSTGCGVAFGPSDELEVDLRGFDGPGLAAWQNSTGDCWGLQVDPGCGLTIDGEDKLAVNPADLAGGGLASGENCELDVQLGCGLQFDGLDRVEVNPLDLESPDVGPTGSGCSLGTKGFTGEKQVVTAIDCDPYDPYACPVAVVETWHFVNGLLKGVT